MVFIVDGSSSVGENNFALVQNFVIDLVEHRFRLENDSARVSYFQYCLFFHFFCGCFLSGTIAILSFFHFALSCLSNNLLTSFYRHHLKFFCIYFSLILGLKINLLTFLCFCAGNVWSESRQVRRAKSLPLKDIKKFKASFISPENSSGLNALTL